MNREYSTGYTVAVELPNHESAPMVRGIKELAHAEELAYCYVSECGHPTGTRVYVVTCGVVLTTYTAI